MLMHHRVTDQDRQEICNMGCMRVICFTNECFKDVWGDAERKEKLEDGYDDARYRLFGTLTDKRC